MCYTFSGGIHTEGTFEWALQQLRLGLRVRRNDWPDKTAHVYMRLVDGPIKDWEIRTVGQQEIGKDATWMAHSHHILATDWEIYVKKCGECGQQTS